MLLNFKIYSVGFRSVLLKDGINGFSRKKVLLSTKDASVCVCINALCGWVTIRAICVSLSCRADTLFLLE